MAAQVKLTEHLDYLQRVGCDPVTLPANPPMISAPDEESRRLVRITGVGCLNKAATPIAKEDPDRPSHLVSEDALIGMSGANVPIAFLVASDSRKVAVHLGIWSAVEEKSTPEQLNRWRAIMESVLNGAFPAVQLKEIRPTELELAHLPLAGIVLGVPSVKPPSPLDNSLQLDRLIRALAGAQWAFIILARPVEENHITAVRNSVVNEMRDVESKANANLAPK